MTAILCLTAAEQRAEERTSVCVVEVGKQKGAIAQTIVAGDGSVVYTSLKEKVDRETEVGGGWGGVRGRRSEECEEQSL